jgi:hypothetical protein
LIEIKFQFQAQSSMMFNPRHHPAHETLDQKLPAKPLYNDDMLSGAAHECIINPRGMGRCEGRPMMNYIPSETLARVDSSRQSGADAFTRSMLLKRLLHEAEKPCLTR